MPFPKLLLLFLSVCSVFEIRAADLSLFDQKNLAAWCIVPFDKAKRGPEQRAAMLEKLGLTQFVYDYRKEHIPTFDAELDALKKHHVELIGWWFPTVLNEEAKMTLDLFKRHNVKPVLWISGGGERPKTKDETEKRYASEVARIKPIAQAAQAQGLKVGLYNHGGWFGEPETQVEIIKRLAMPNVGMIYNLHHGHDHVKRLRQILELIKPHLLCFNLNGMMEDGEKRGMKIVPLAQGQQDIDVMKIIAASGYQGPIGILNHTDEDAEERLSDNLDGLRWLVKTIKGEPAGEKPKPRSWTRPPERKTSAGAGPTSVPSINAAFGKALRGTLIVGGKPDYHTRPFTIECRAKLDSKTGYNILVARDAKASADHWELYTHAKSGELALFQPGRGGDVKSKVDVCDGQWHHLAAVVEEARVRLFVDGKQVAEKPATPMTGKAQPGALAIGGLAEGTLHCDGVIDDVRLSKGAREIQVINEPVKADAQTIEAWNFDSIMAASEAVPVPASFFYQFDPLRPELWPNREHEVNHYRLYDFYAKEALAFKGKPAKGLLAAYPGLEAGLFGHWGIADDEVWKDGRWAKAKRTPLQSAILHTPFGVFPKAVVIQLGAKEELTTFFDPETLCFPMVTGGSFVGMSDGRHGFMNGVRFNAAITQRMEQPKPKGEVVYHGFYRFGAKFVFSYALDGKELLDHAWADNSHWVRETCPKGEQPLTAMTQGGPAQWPAWLETQGVAGTEKPYALDTLTLPKHPDGHPWFISGHDFFKDGSAALCTMTGDVWIVRGLDTDLKKLRWKRYAAGLHQPLGLRIVDEKICVQGRDQLTRLIDLNGDDEADFYECLSNAQTTSPSGHDFITGCEFDGTHFYFASGNQGVCRVKPGSPVEVLATGFRNPNGLGLARDGTLTTTVQEGDWTPTSMLHQIKAGGFYGHGGPKPGIETQQPMAYVPRGLDNSSGGQCFTETAKWGPLGGQLIHFSPGTANHFLVLRQTIGDTTQGAVVWLPGDFLSGAQQGRINPADGQLYVSGMYGWGCYGRDDGCFQRMRYTGGPAHLPVAFAAHENGVLIKFSDALGSVAGDVTQHFAQCWNYRYSAAYGSPEFSVSHPDVEGHDALEITAVHVLEGRKTLFLEMPLLTPSHQVHVHVSTIEDRYQDLFITAHKLAPAFTNFPGYTAAPKQYIAVSKSGNAQQSKPNPWAQGKKGRPLDLAAAVGLRFAQPELHAKAGERLSLTFSNPDVVPHNWVLIAPNKLQAIGDATNKLIADPAALAKHYIPETKDVLAYTAMVNPNGKFTIHFDAPKSPGRYPYLCTFPGHWVVMNGVMVVE
jgi:azurin/sugar phosphate isomerase/epimerase